MRAIRVVIFFCLFLIFTHSNVNEKSKIINNLKNIDSIIFKNGNKIFFEGQAIIMIFENIDNNWNYLAKGLKLIPINVLDTAYRWVSGNRAKVSVKKVSSCPIVPRYYQKRFIL